MLSGDFLLGGFNFNPTYAIDLSPPPPPSVVGLLFSSFFLSLVHDVFAFERLGITYLKNGIDSKVYVQIARVTTGLKIQEGTRRVFSSRGRSLKASMRVF